MSLDDELMGSLRYENKKKIGKGAYGEVNIAVDRKLGLQVAIKSIKIISKQNGLPKAIFREIESLKQLSDCVNIVKILDVYPQGSNVCLVFEYLPSDLSEVISQANTYLPIGMMKTYAVMIFRALSYCHFHNIIHRDLKPSNILLSRSGEIKLADFGLARIYDPSDPDTMSHQVATRWYRAPELLYASRTYDFKVDIWSAGCIIAELMMLAPLFPGSNDIDQMFRVFQIMGSPDLMDWPEVEQLPDYCKISFPTMKAINLHILIPQVKIQDITFLSNMLQLNPSRRLSADQILINDYFTHEPLAYPLSELPVPSRQPIKSEKKSFNLSELQAMEQRWNGCKDPF